MASLYTLHDLLQQRAESQLPSRLFIYPLGKTDAEPMVVTYTDLHDEAKLRSQAVRRLEGFHEGEPVLLHFSGHWDTILWFWAVVLAGGLPVLSTPFGNLKEHRHRHIKALSELLQSPICLTSAQALADFGSDHDMYLYSTESILEDNTTSRKNENENAECCQHHANLDGNHSPGNPCILNDNNGEEVAVLLLTSGTTGNSKAVELTHAQIFAAVAGKASARQLPHGRPFLNWIGLDHAAGLIEMHMQALWLNVDQIHVSAADIVPSPRLFVELLSRHGVSRKFAPIFFLAMLFGAG
jgi:acyl-CoA synthetase (AMP-forming)/AMP-acid ligase II